MIEITHTITHIDVFVFRTHKNYMTSIKLERFHTQIRYEMTMCVLCLGVCVCCFGVSVFVVCI